MSDASFSDFSEFDPLGNPLFSPVVLSVGFCSKHEWNKKKSLESVSMPPVPTLGEERKNRLFNFSPLVVNSKGILERGSATFSIWSNDAASFNVLKPGYVFSSFDFRPKDREFSLSGFKVLLDLTDDDIADLRQHLHSLKLKGFSANMVAVFNFVSRLREERLALATVPFLEEKVSGGNGKIYHSL